MSLSIDKRWLIVSERLVGKSLLTISYGRISQIPQKQVQNYLSTCFSKWGLPKSIRVDNGKPLGDPQRKRIPELALWLIGLGIQIIFNRPRRPTDNAKVERM